LEIRRQDIIEIVNKAKDEIEKIRKSSIEDKKTMDEISLLIAKLKDIKTALEPKQKTLKERIANLNSILEELSDIKFDIILNDSDNIFNAIEHNLLDGMSLRSVEDTKNIKLIIFEGEEVGSIEVLEENKPDIKIRVMIYNNTDEFPIYDPLKMYSIISFINTKFNYKQE